MKCIIYIDNGKFKWTDLPTWEGLTSTYRLRKIEKTLKFIEVSEDYFNAIQCQPENSHSVQNELRRLYDGH